MQKNQNLSVRWPIVEIPYGIAIDVGELLWRRLLTQPIIPLKICFLLLDVISFQAMRYTYTDPEGSWCFAHRLRGLQVIVSSL
jgi:hypothetical protein